MRYCNRIIEIGVVDIEYILEDLAKDGCIAEAIGIYIFGTGKGGITLQQYLQRRSFFNKRQFIVKGFFDNDTSKQGTVIDGVNVTSPQVHLIGRDDYVFITSLRYDKEMTQQLRGDGLAACNIILAEDYLRNLLQKSESRALLINGIKPHFQKMLADVEAKFSTDKEFGIFIFGTGLGGQNLYYHLMEYGRNRHSRFRIKAFLDNDIVKQKMDFEGIPTIAPDNINRNDTDIIIIASNKYGSEMQKQLVDLGVQEAEIVLHGEWLKEIMPANSQTAMIKDVLDKEQFVDHKRIFKAGSSKKTILVMDNHVPHYDQDAGGRCTYEYLKLFLELGLRIVFIGDYRRDEPYTSELEQMGIIVLYGEWHKRNFTQWLKENGKYIEYAYLNRPYVARPVIDDIRKYSQAKIIYFAHDLHFLREYRQYQVENNPRMLVASEKSKKMEYEIFDKTDVIYVVGSYEQEYLQKEFPQKIIRNIPLFLAENSKYESCAKNSFEETRDIMFVGGFKHTPNLDAMQWFINEIFPVVVEKIPDIKLYVVGSNPPYSLRRITNPNIIVTGFVSDEELRDYYKRIRLVVAPLRYGAGIKGKIIEAMLNRTPVITTSIGAEGLPDVEGKIMVVDREDDFAERVAKVYENKLLWEHRSYNGFEYVKNNFSKERAMSICLSDIEP